MSGDDMTDAHRLEPLRRRFFTGEFSVATPQCLDPDTIAALADGTLAATARAAALAHVARCTVCRQAIASVSRALDDGPVTHEVEIVDGRRRRPRYALRIGAPLAAAAVLLVLLWGPGNDGPGVHRGGGASTPPKPIGPVGTVAGARALLWTSVFGADQYRVTVFDAVGGIVYEGESRDTALALPASVLLLPGQRYLWSVQARTSVDRWEGSALVEFTIARGPPE
jgi:hypothetical protein